MISTKAGDKAQAHIGTFPTCPIGVDARKSICTCAEIQAFANFLVSIAKNIRIKLWHGTWSKNSNEIAINVMDINEYFLMSCPNMVGFNEGWVIDNHVFVSPAVFQLLTDEDDWQTRMCVARQLVLKHATYKDLKALLDATTPPRRIMKTGVATSY